MRLSLAFAALTLLACLGCREVPATAVARMKLVAVETAPQADTSRATLPVVAGGGTQQLRILGQVSLPKGLQGLANAHDGVVAGAPVEVLDVASGQHIGSGVTYYDGSFSATVPATVGKRAALLQVMLVDAQSHQDLFPLVSALELSPELTEQQADIDPGSTTWVALLCKLAAQKAKAPVPDWTHLTPGGSNTTMGQMVAGSETTALGQFALFAQTQKGLMTSSSPQELRKAIDTIVSELLATAKPAS